MARDRDSDTSSTGQSKRASLNRPDSDSQVSDQAQQHSAQPHPPHRTKAAQKHVVGGGTGGRLHARVPSSKALQKHHASAVKLNRSRHGSLSPDRSTTAAAFAAAAAATGAAAGGGPFVPTHRRATSELKLSRDSSTTQLSKNTSQVSLKRNKSNADVGSSNRKSKSATNLKRSSSNHSVEKLKAAAKAAAYAAASSKVHFNLGDDGQEDEWVDASASASPHLSRRGSAVADGNASGRSSANPPSSANSSRLQSPYESDGDGNGDNNDDDDDDDDENNGNEGDAQAQARAQAQAQSQAASLSGAGTVNGGERGGGSASGSQKTMIMHSDSEQRAAVASHKQYLTSRLLQRAPSYGAPPKMTIENASVRPPSESRQQSPDGRGGGFNRADTPQVAPGSPQSRAVSRPGSSGKEGLTSRFVGNNSQGSGSGSGVPVDSFLTSMQRGGLARAAADLSEGDRRAAYAKNKLGEAATSGLASANEEDSPMTDEEDADNKGLTTTARQHRHGTFALPRDMNRTQQKLNLQRASSTLESTPAHPHPGVGIGGISMEMGMGLAGGGAATAGPMMGGSSGYESRDPRLTKLLENTGMEYLVVRRYQNPIARSIHRIMHRLDLEKTWQAQAQAQAQNPSAATPNTHRPSTASHPTPNASNKRASGATTEASRDPAVAELLSAQASGGKRPNTPRRTAARSSGGGGNDDPSTRMREGTAAAAAAGGAREETHAEADLTAALRNLWEKPVDFGASSQD